MTGRTGSEGKAVGCAGTVLDGNKLRWNDLLRSSPAHTWPADTPVLFPSVHGGALRTRGGAQTLSFASGWRQRWPGGGQRRVTAPSACSQEDFMTNQAPRGAPSPRPPGLSRAREGGHPELGGAGCVCGKPRLGLCLLEPEQTTGRTCSGSADTGMRELPSPMLAQMLAHS